MGKLRIVPEGVYTNYNQSMLSGYAAIAFSLDRKSASAIAAENKLSNIISRHIIDMKYETLINEQVRITNYLTNNYFVWNKIKPHSDLIDICINYMNIFKVCKINEFDNVLLIINSNTKESVIKLLKYLAEQLDINVDLIIP